MSIKNIETIKQLNSQISKMEGEIIGLKETISGYNKELNLKSNRLKELKNKVKSMSHDGIIRVSEHALLRYLERVTGLNIPNVEKEILEESVVNAINILGNGTYPHSKGFKVRVKDNNIVTILKDDSID